MRSLGRSAVKDSRRSEHVLRSILLVITLAVIWQWWVTTAAGMGATTGTALIAVSELTGLLAGVGVLVLLLLMGRVPWFERGVGMANLTAWHRSLGTTVVLLVVTHLTLMWIGGAVADGLNLWAEIVALFTYIPDMTITVIGTAFLLLIGLISVRPIRKALRYETWYAWHLTVYLAVFLTFWHQVEAGTHVGGDGLLPAVWSALYVGTGLVVLWYRFGAIVVFNIRGQFRVEQIVAEGTKATSVWVTGAVVPPVQAGQFFILRFDAPGHRLSGHPYSVSNVVDSGRLRFTIGHLGDHSTASRRLRRGTRVFLEGPFGTFTAAAATQPAAVLIAGGAGIGPIRALAQELHQQGTDVVVLQRGSEPGPQPLGAELRPQERLRYIPLTGTRRKLGYDPISPTHLHQLVPDIADRDVFICGSDGLVRTAAASANALGVPQNQIHFEELNTL